MERKAYLIYSILVTVVCTAAVVATAIGVLMLAYQGPAPVIVIYEQPQQQAEPETMCFVVAGPVVPAECPDGDPVEVNAPEVDQFDPAEVNALARLVWGEARGCPVTEQAAVIWCVLNRVDSELAYFPDTIMEVITQRNAFTGYSTRNPVETEFCDLALDVLARWRDEHAGAVAVGRVLPAEYTYFSGDGRHNYFRATYAAGPSWDFSLDSPYQ